MKHVPILFSTEMVKAILEGRKTQTRRTIKPQPEDHWIENTKKFCPPDGSMFDKNGKQLYWLCNPLATKESNMEIKPKAKISDVFWVRETWAEVGNFASNQFANSEVIGYKTEHALWYDTKKPLDTFAWAWDKIKWKPSIFMPKDACRLFLEVTNVRVERLNHISEEDAKAEGIQCITGGKDDDRILGWHDYTVDPKYGFNTFFNPIESFHSLWESINGKKSLESNPFVWVYDFKIVEKPVDFI